MKIRTSVISGACLAFALILTPAFASAQTSSSGSTATTQPPASDPDSRLDPLQPDFNLAALPTTLRLPQNRMAFRVTHRFNRNLGRGDFGDLVSDFFGFDSGAQIGLELRYGLMRGTQVGIYRTSNRAIEIFGQQSVWQEKPDGHPLGIDVIATLEGADNLSEHFQSAVGILVSRKVGHVAALYAEPIYIFNTNSAEPPDAADNNTMMLGLGGRVRILPTVYVVGEVTPRLAGYTPGVPQGSFGIEARAGGHLFQLNFSNGLATTLGQVALGGIAKDQWFIGFNICRKFF
jgi:hypothetical protein